MDVYQDCFSIPIRLPKTPVSSVASVKYVLANGTEMTVDPSIYLVKVNGDIVTKWSKFWPIDILTTGDAVRVRFTAGYDVGQLPETTKQGMLLLIGHWYENREAVTMSTKAPFKVPLAVESLLWMDRSW